MVYIIKELAWILLVCKFRNNHHQKLEEIPQKVQFKIIKGKPQIYQHILLIQLMCILVIKVQGVVQIRRTARDH
jgi:hypothetical protein